MKEYSGLENIRSTGGSGVYCPSCNNYLEVVANGLFHGYLFFCPKEDLVFQIYLRDITKIAGEHFIKEKKERVEMESTKNLITHDNYKKVREFLDREKGER